MMTGARRRFYLTEECCRSTVRSVKVSKYNSKLAIKNFDSLFSERQYFSEHIEVLSMIATSSILKQRSLGLEQL